MHHVSFSENDAEMLAVFDASLPSSGIDGNKLVMDCEVKSENDYTIGSKIVGSSSSSEPAELLNATIMLPVQCSKSNCASGGTDVGIRSSQHQKVSDVDYCRVPKSNNSPDYVTNERCIAEVESANSNTVNVGSRPTASTGRAPSSVVSVKRRSAGRLSEKIKQTLRQNAKVDTPKRLNRLSAIIQKYDIQAADLTDIGPFYGLPVKVKQMLETQRSITEFYRKFLCFINCDDAVIVYG